MVESLNSRADFVTTSNWMSGGVMGRHGRILVGNKAFEFYNDRNPADFVQIPWGEIRQVRAIMLMKRGFIRGFFIDTKSAGTYHFVVSKAGQTLKAMRNYLAEEQLVRNKPIFSLAKLWKEWRHKKAKKQ